MIARLNAPYVRMRPWKAVTRLASYGLFEGRAVLQPGRFVNPLVFGIYGMARRLPQLRDVDRPMFLIGMGRSGTTILGLVLSFHRDVGFLNEPKALWHAVHGEEDVIGSFGEGPARYRLDAGDASAARARDARRIVGLYLAATGARRLMDKSEATFRVPFLQRIFPDALFFFLVRNGWDVCRSVARWSEEHGRGRGAERLDWWGRGGRKWRLLVEQIAAGDDAFRDRVGELLALERDLDRAAVEWTLTMREGLARIETHGDAVLRVDYERLAERPDDALARIAAFAGLRPDDRWLEYGRTVLRPAPPRPTFEPHPAVAGPFRATLERLGYPTG